MKIEKKVIIYILLFIFVFFFSYILVTTFFFTTLNFKPYYQSDEIYNGNSNKIIYILNEEDEIMMARKKENYININKISHKDKEPKTIMSIDVNNDTLMTSFEQIGNYYYIFYNSGKSIIKIDLNAKESLFYEDLPDGIIIINQFDNQLYLCDSNIIYQLNYNDNKYDKLQQYTIPSYINSIKDIHFVSQNDYYVSTYNSKIYYFKNNQLIKEFIYDDYTIKNNTLYYVLNQNNKLLIASYNENTDINFEIKKVEYVSIKVKNDYLYLINNEEINKVCISRMKKHDKMVISGYDQYDFNLENILIVSDKLMYLPMLKQNIDINGNVTYTPCLHRYK